MNKLSRVLALVLVCAMMLSSALIVSASSFPDVAANSQYEQAIDLLASLKVLGGYEDGTFKPENNITRAEFAKIVYVVFNGFSDVDADMYKSQPAFSDTADQWFTGHVNWAYLNSIVGGYGDGTFLPNNNIAVKEAIKMIVTCVTDRELSYPNGYIQEARANGLLQDVVIANNDANATRGQVAQMAYNLLFTNSRLCLESTGQLNANGTEIYAKRPAITFVFGLNSRGTEEDSYIFKLAGTYDDLFLGANDGLTLEEGQVAFYAYNKTADGKAGDRVRNTPYIYDYSGDLSTYVGQYLELYLTDKDQLAAVVSRGNAIFTTKNKIRGNGTSTPLTVDGQTLQVEGYIDDVTVTGGVSTTTRYRVFDAVYWQLPSGTWVETMTDGTALRLTSWFGTSTRAYDEPIAVIDADGDGYYDTYMQYFTGTYRISTYNAAGRVLRFSGQPTDTGTSTGVVGGYMDYTADYVIGFEKFASFDYKDATRPVYANCTVAIKGDGRPYVTAEPAEYAEGILESISSNGQSAVIGGQSYTSYYITSTNDSFGFFNYEQNHLGDYVRVYLDKCGYAQTLTVISENEEYGLNIVKVIGADDSADRFGYNVKASVTVVAMDGTQATYNLATEEDVDNLVSDFYTEVPAQWLKTAADEDFWAYDTAKKDYKIVGNYVQLEVDEETDVVKKIMTLDELAANGPTSTVATNDKWSKIEINNDICYNAEEGFFRGSKVNPEINVAWAADDFKGMYYEENAQGELETGFYTVDTIPEFYNQAKGTLILVNNEVIAMILTEAPASFDQDRVLGIITNWGTVAGETMLPNNKNSYRIKVEMWVDGATKTFYTEDFASDKLPAIDIANDTNREGLGRDQFVYLQLLSNGKIKVKNGVNASKVLDVTYLNNADLNFAYAENVRGNIVQIKDVTGVKNTVQAGWYMDETTGVYENHSYEPGSIKTSGSTHAVRLCDETTYYTINKMEDVDNVAIDEAFQSVMPSQVTVGGSISQSDVDNGAYYVFAYTILTADTARNADNVGKVGTVFVFTSPVVAPAN